MSYAQKSGATSGHAFVSAMRRRQGLPATMEGMAITIGSNIAALAAQRRIGESTTALTKTFERLSSGLRINRASDDAAGLAISSSLNVDARIYGQAIRNVNDALSMAAISEGTLRELTNIVIRQTELAEQAANGALSAVQRRSLDREYQALDAEIRRIADTTTFNGNPLFSGTTRAITQTTVASGATYSQQLSADGRYLTYRDASNNLVQRDLTLGTVTTIASNVSPAGIAASASGGVIAFSSSANINGLNPSGRSTVYVYDKASGTFTKAIDSGAGESIGAIAISADGSTVAFTSQGQYASNGSLSVAATGAEYLHAYSTESRTVTNLGWAAGGSSESVTSISVSTYGTYISYFQDDSNEGELQLGVARTSTPGSNHQRSIIGADGSYEHLNTLENGSVLMNGALAYTPHIALYTGYGIPLQQIGRSDGGQIEALRLSHDGSYFTFYTAADYTNSGLTGNRVFRYDFNTGQFTAMTEEGLGNYGSVLSADGSTLVENTGTALVLTQVGRNAQSLSIETGSGTGSDASIASLIATVRSSLRGLGGHQLSTASAARGALDATRTNVGQLSIDQGKIGSALSRLLSAGRVVQAQHQEITIARSRIIDADVATEYSQLVRTQIAQQTSTALLAQANQSPALALQLLGDG